MLFLDHLSAFKSFTAISEFFDDEMAFDDSVYYQGLPIVIQWFVVGFAFICPSIAAFMPISS